MLMLLCYVDFNVGMVKAYGNCRMQVHAWVTAMSMTWEKLQPWETLKRHPCVQVMAKTAKRPSTTSQGDSIKRLSLTPVVGKPTQSEASNKSIAGTCTQGRQSLSPTLHAHASSSGHDMASLVQYGLSLESFAQQAASEFLIGSIQSVRAVGTSRPVFNAR